MEPGEARLADELPVASNPTPPTVARLLELSVASEPSEEAASPKRASSPGPSPDAALDSNGLRRSNRRHSTVATKDFVSSSSLLVDSDDPFSTDSDDEYRPDEKKSKQIAEKATRTKQEKKKKINMVKKQSRIIAAGPASPAFVSVGGGGPVDILKVNTPVALASSSAAESGSSPGTIGQTTFVPIKIQYAVDNIKISSSTIPSSSGEVTPPAVSIPTKVILCAKSPMYARAPAPAAGPLRHLTRTPFPVRLAASPRAPVPLQRIAPSGFSVPSVSRRVDRLTILPQPTATQLSGVCEILRTALMATSATGTMLDKKACEFIEKKISTASIRDESSVIVYAKKTLDLIDLAKQSLESISVAFRSELGLYANANGLRKALDSDEKLREALCQSPKPNGEDGGGDSDCEIVDAIDHKPEHRPDVLDTLKNLEMRGISIKSRAPAGPRISNVRGSYSDAVDHHTFIPPSRPSNESSFFRLGGRMPKPPDGAASGRIQTLRTAAPALAAPTPELRRLVLTDQNSNRLSCFVTPVNTVKCQKIASSSYKHEKEQELHSNYDEQSFQDKMVHDDLMSEDKENVFKISKKKSCFGKRSSIKMKISSKSDPNGAFFKGRKNIRKIVDKDSLSVMTKMAAKKEKERLKRLVERKNLMAESFQSSHNNKLAELVLDFDSSTKKPIVSVHPTLARILKCHQVDGVKFMWDSCFESLDMISHNNEGNGCILAHCMGLGKTLQVIALIHTVLTSDIIPMRTVLICCPLTTVLNWVDEFHKWLSKINDSKKIPIYELSRFRKNIDRWLLLEEWYKKGGVFIIGYEMFRHLTTNIKENTHIKKKKIDRIRQILLDPGPDIVVCDEGHLLKNNNTFLSKSMNMISTKRRIVLTGTPLQNNLKEYYCMVNFVKPNLLGSQKEYANRFEIPITNGQHRDSSKKDIDVMKKRSHVLHKMLEGCVQRKEASVLYEYLPTKEEYVLLLPLSNIQANLYQRYLNYVKSEIKEATNLSILRNYSIFQKIWTHPLLVQESIPKWILKNEDEVPNDILPGRKIIDQKNSKHQPIVVNTCLPNSPTDMISSFPEEEKSLNTLSVSHKFIVVFSILNECLKVGDKLILFSSSLDTLDTVEYFLKKEIKWERGCQYFRIDGTVDMQTRRKYCIRFNSVSNINTRLFLVSTKVGGLGINMTAANRVILMDVSWNPSYDLQSIFRIYRFGQKKKCFIYRLVASGTMEEKIYERSVTKQAVACRVVDEHQIDRHYNMSDSVDLYSFTHLPNTLKPTPILPKDRELANVIENLKYTSGNKCPIIWSIHEHDSLLRDLHDEQLDEEERKAAWIEFETEKTNKENGFHFDKNKFVKILNTFSLSTDVPLNKPIPLGWYSNNNEFKEDTMNSSDKPFACIDSSGLNNANMSNCDESGFFNNANLLHVNSMVPIRRENNSIHTIKKYNAIKTYRKHYQPLVSTNKKYTKILIKPYKSDFSKKCFVSSLPNGKIIHRSPRKINQIKSKRQEKSITTNDKTIMVDLTNLPDTPNKAKQNTVFRPNSRKTSIQIKPHKSSKENKYLTPNKQFSIKKTFKPTFAKKLNFTDSVVNQFSKNITNDTIEKSENSADCIISADGQ